MTAFGWCVFWGLLVLGIGLMLFEAPWWQTGTVGLLLVGLLTGATWALWHR